MKNENTTSRNSAAEYDPTKPPVCPHCGAELTGCAVWIWKVAFEVVSCVYCVSCRTALHFDTMPIAQNQEPPRIARPS